MRLQRGFAFLAIIAAILLLIVVALLAAWYLVNIPDSALDPGIARVLEGRHDELPAPDNLFFALLAFDSSGDQDLNRQGQAIYSAYLVRRAAGPGSGVRFDNALPIPRRAFVGNSAVLCGARGRWEDCLERASAHPDAVRRLVDDNRMFLDHYAVVSGYTRLQDPIRVTFNSPLAPWYTFMLGKRLYLTDIALQAGAGQIDQALGRLGADILFTRRLLAQQDILTLDKMILASSLEDDLGLASELVRTVRLSDGRYSQLATALAPLTDDERSFAGPLTRDFENFAAFSKDLGMSALESHFFKYHSTLDAQWRILAEKVALSRGSCTSFLAGVSAITNRPAGGIGRLVYNPIGNMISAAAMQGSLEYLHAMCDLDGMLRIVRLQVDVRLAHVNDDQLGRFVRNGGPRYCNPFTGRPMDVDVVHRTIGFQPLAQRDRGFFPWPL